MIDGMCTGRARFHTSATADAKAGVVEELRMPALGFRVVAPFAAEGAALEEHGGPNAGTIVGAETLDIED